MSEPLVPLFKDRVQQLECDLENVKNHCTLYLTQWKMCQERERALQDRVHELESKNNE